MQTKHFSLMEAIWRQLIYIVVLNVENTVIYRKLRHQYGICLWCQMCQIVPLSIFGPFWVSEYTAFLLISQCKDTLYTYALKILSFLYKTMWFCTHYNVFCNVRTQPKYLKQATRHSMQGLVFCPRMLRRDASDSKCILEVQSEKRRQRFSTITSVCVRVFINPQTDRKRDQDWQPVISAILSLPSLLHWYADRAFQLLSVFSSREVCVYLRLEARVRHKGASAEGADWLFTWSLVSASSSGPDRGLARLSFGGRTHIPSGSEYQMWLSQM